VNGHENKRRTVRQYDDEDGCPSDGGLPLVRLTNLQWLRGKNERWLWKKEMKGKRNRTRRRFVEAKSGCWQKNKTNRLLTFPPFSLFSSVRE